MSGRTLSGPIDAALDDALIVPVIFLELQFDDGTLRLHTDLGTIVTTSTSPNLSWTGVGSIGQIDEIEDTATFSPTGVKARLSGINSTILNEAVSENYYERPARILIGLRNSATGAMLDNPHEIFFGKIDKMNIMYGREVSVIEVSLESEFADFEKATMEHYTDSQLQKEYAGDLGLQYLSQMIDAKVMWGNKNATNSYAMGGRIKYVSKFQRILRGGI